MVLLQQLPLASNTLVSQGTGKRITNRKRDKRKRHNQTKPNQTKPRTGITGCYWVLLGVTGCYWVLLATGVTGLSKLAPPNLPLPSPMFPSHVWKIQASEHASSPLRPSWFFYLLAQSLSSQLSDFFPMQGGKIKDEKTELRYPTLRSLDLSDQAGISKCPMGAASTVALRSLRKAS
jgi:hypothetical protein